MTKSNIPGLFPLWLIMLALVLGVLIVVMIPRLDCRRRRH
jgi:hypothetical protein